MTKELFAELIRQYEPLVFTICYQMVRDYHEAQNLAQDAFLSAYRSIDRCPPESFRPWLARIATNKAKDHLKSAYARRVTTGEEERLEALPGGTAPDQLVIDRDETHRIADTIRSLREPYGKVSTLYFLEECTVEEISRLLERPPKTVQTQLLRAKVILQGMLREEKPQ